MTTMVDPIEILQARCAALPLGYSNALEQAVYPRYDKDASMTLLGLRGRSEADALVERINSDENFFGTP